MGGTGVVWAAERVEPDAGWGRIVALAIAVGVFYGVRWLLREVLSPWLKRAGRPSPQVVQTLPAAEPQGRGHLYVVAFSTGTVKVGKTKRPDKRIDEHRAAAAAYGGRISDEWVSPAHDGYGANEVRLIDACAKVGKQHKREYFSDLPFARAVELATGIVGGGEVLPAAPGRVGHPLMRRARAVVRAWTDEPQPVVAAPAAALPPSPVEVATPRPAPNPQLHVDTDAEQIEVFDRADPVGEVPPGEHGHAIQQVLNHAGLDARVTRCRRGPISSRYELATAPGVPVERIKRVASSIAAACRVDTVSIALVAGRGTVGVDVVNEHRALVPLVDVLAAAGATAPPLTLGIGASLDGMVTPDLAKMPHLLVAGASGSGKSMVVNACLLSLVRQPVDEVGLVLVDVKHVELAAYAQVPHLALPVVVEARHAAGALEWVVREMSSRYRRMAEVGARDIAAFNKVADKRMQRLVVVVDELSGLMPAYRDDCEQHLVDIGERGRAAGVHMILATQSPRAEVVTGRIKANVTGRLALTTTDKLESRIILDRNGAEGLRGEGDALLLTPGSALTRVQGSFVSDADVAAAVAAASGGVDQMAQLREAARLVVDVGYGSTSMLQSRMRLGWPAARRLLGELESRGVVGPAEGNKPRRVLLGGDALDVAMRSWG